MKCDGPLVTALLASILGISAFRPFPLIAQSAAMEKAIANLPPGQRAYERFRAWITALPPDQQRAPDVEQRYRAYLKRRGLTDGDAAEQLKLLKEQGARSEIERWNRILTAQQPGFNTKANAFLMEIAKSRKPGAALDVGMGQGRNSIWLAQQGWSVTGFDPAERAVAQARETASKLGLDLRTEVRRMEEFHFGEHRWDLILMSYVGGREMVDAIQRALKPGGVLVIEAFHLDATRVRPVGAARVFDTGELPALYRELRVVRYEEPVADADFGLERVRLVRYCGERPE